MFGRRATVNTGTEGRVHESVLGNERVIVNIPSVPVFTRALPQTLAPIACAPLKSAKPNPSGPMR